jgi:hypothetical protein
MPALMAFAGPTYSSGETALGGWFNVRDVGYMGYGLSDAFSLLAQGMYAHIGKN